MEDYFAKLLFNFNKLKKLPYKAVQIVFLSCCSQFFREQSVFIPLVFLHLFQVADQQAAMFGQCCFDAGDVNCTMGTGSFVDINTGSYPHASVAGKTEHMPISLWRREAIHQSYCRNPCKRKNTFSY